MIDLRTLGSLDLRADDGRRLQSIVAQPKRLALLAYLAVTAPRGFQQRDKLLGLFWPERDEEHARNSLSQSLTYLRRSLGEEVIVTQGPGVSVDREKIRCDVTAFECALEEGEFAKALQLYEGEFLDGLYVSDALGFEHWLEQERARLRDRVVEAAWNLADEAERSTSPSSALAWAERAVAFRPDDETSVRRLLSLLARLGNRAGAIRTYEEFAQRLRERYDLEPSGETQALVEAWRRAEESSAAWQARPHLREEAPRPIAPSVPGNTGANGEEDPAAEKEPPEAPRHGESAALTALRAGSRSWRSAAIAAWVLLVFVAAALVERDWFAATDLNPDLYSDRILVAPFENRTNDPALDPLSNLAADWITQGLSRSGLVEVIDPATALLTSQVVTPEPDAAAGLARARVLAEATRSGTVVWGAYYRRGDTLHFQAQVTDVRRGRLLRLVEPVTAVLPDPMPGLETLRQRVMGVLAVLRDEQLATLSTPGSQPPTFDAYLAYMQGLERFNREEYKEAIPHFRQAAARDSTFVLSYVWMAFSFWNAGEGARRDSTVAILARMRERLAPLDRFALEYFEATPGEGPHDQLAAYQAARKAAKLAPESNWAFLAGRIALDLHRAREAVEILRSIDPERGWMRTWFHYWYPLTYGLHRLGEHEEELEEARRALRLHPNLVSLLFEIMPLAAQGRAEELERSLNAQLSLPQVHPEISVGYLLRKAGEELKIHGYPEAAPPFFERALRWYEELPAEEKTQRRRRWELASALYGLERWEEAEPIYRQLAAEDSTSDMAYFYQGRAGVLAAKRGDRAEAERIMQWLASREGKPLAWSTTFHRAVIAAHLGDRRQALRLLGDLFRRGGYGQILHADLTLEPLWSDPEFQELIRPRE